MDQEKFINDLLETWGLTGCKSVSTPGVKSSVDLEELFLPKDQIDPKEEHQAQKLAGSLIWISTRTRLELTNAQSRISSLQTKNPVRASEEGKRALRHLSVRRCELRKRTFTDRNCHQYGWQQHCLEVMQAERDSYKFGRQRSTGDAVYSSFWVRRPGS